MKNELKARTSGDRVYFLLGTGKDKIVISIFDADGKKIFEEATMQNLYEFNCKLLANGSYKFNVKQDDKVYKSGNFVIIH